MEVEILCTESIKPSSSTPSHLKIHKLSSLDQSMPHHYIPLFFFYPQSQTQTQTQTQTRERSQLLKSSLSQLLTLFYPFAGSILPERFSVLCDDHGVPFTHAVASLPLSDFLQSLEPSCLPKLLPDQLDANGLRTDVAMVQVTDFLCGGFVISALFSHAVADMAAAAFFLKSWATLCRESDLSLLATKLRPDFNASILLPPADHVPAEAQMVPWDLFAKEGKLRVKRLVFGPSAICALKKKAASQSVPNPTRVQVVSGHLAKCIISALDAKSGCKNGAMIAQSVNLRRRAEPPFPEGSIGNYLWPAVVEPVGEKGNELADVVSELREATDKIDGDFVERMRAMGPEKLLEELGKVFSGGAAAGREFIQFTSRCNFGLYEIDFGWGKPIWMCGVAPPPSPATMFLNLVVLMDTRSRDGVEALLFLDEEDIAWLEASEELLAYDVFHKSPVL